MPLNSPHLSTEEQAGAYLERIRKHSCYRTLRLVINIAAVLGLSFLVIYVGRLLVAAVDAPLAGGAPALLIGYAIGTALSGGVVIFLAWQASLLFVDLVDAQIEKNARS